MYKYPKQILVVIFVSVVLFTAMTQRSYALESNGILIGAEPTVAQELTDKAVSSWPWYLTRASGLVASIALFLLMFSGIGFITGSTYRFLEPITGWATHRALGIIFAVALVVHIGALYFDSFVPFNLSDLLIPFQSSYKPISLFGYPVGSLYVALGIISLYLIGLIVLTSLLWMEKIPKTWKVTHILSYLVMLLVFIHALYLGTDLANGILRWLWIMLGALILWASLTRLWRAKTI